MWKDYSAGYIKHNRSAGATIIIAAFISALLLSLLCGGFYNLWKYEVERIELEEGGWQSRIVGELDEADIEAVRNFAHIKEAVVNEAETKGQETVLDLCFDHMGMVFEDTPRIAELVGIPPEDVTYNYPLMAMYLVRDSSDRAPRLLFPMFLFILVLASVSLIVIIHNSFAVSMNGRLHQFGIFASIGATPKQIRTCLLQEAAALCAVPVLAGNAFGILGSMVLIHLTNVLLGSDIPGRHRAVFGYHPIVLGVTLLATVLTVWISAWLPAWKLSRCTPLEAIKNTGELQLKRKKNYRMLTLLFGVEGELAGNALKAQRKALRTASLSLVLSFLAFTIMQSFFATSDISIRETYFERYQDVWDIMVTVPGAEVDSLQETEEIQSLPGVERAITYQKARAKRLISQGEMTEDMKSFGGFSHAAGSEVVQTEKGWVVNAPVVILDDTSFLAYCDELGIVPGLDGAVILNQIRDVTNPDFRHPDYMPYVKETGTSVLLQRGNEEMAAEIPVLAYTDKEPALREEYATLDYYELVHFLPASLWSKIKGQIGGAEEETLICVLGKGQVTGEELSSLQGEIEGRLSGAYTVESENRIQERELNERQINGMKTVFGGLCLLLALIGIGNVFSNTLGFMRQRRREFARYLSVGVTPEGLRKMFCIEALVLAGRPVLITLPLAVLAVWGMLKMSYLGVREFLAEAPMVSVGIFMLGILGSVALAYYLGWRNVKRMDLAEVLRDDTMM